MTHTHTRFASQSLYLVNTPSCNNAIISLQWELASASNQSLTVQSFLKLRKNYAISSLFSYNSKHACSVGGLNRGRNW